MEYSLRTSVKLFFNNRYYLIWSFIYWLLVILMNCFYLSYNHRVLFEIPPSWLVACLLVDTVLYFAGVLLVILRYGVERSAYLTSVKVVLSLVTSIMLITGFIYPMSANVQTFSTSVVNISSKSNQTFKEANINSNYLITIQKEQLQNSYSEGHIYVFYKIECIYCQATFPKLFSSITETEKAHVTFVNLDSERGKKLGQQYGVKTAATAVAIEKNSTTGNWETEVLHLAKGTPSNPKVNTSAMNSLVSIIKNREK